MIDAVTLLGSRPRALAYNPSHTDISTTLMKREAGILEQHVYSLVLPYTATPITNQKSSGRYWLFASTNVVRYTAAQEVSTAEVEHSQTLCWCLWLGIDG